MLIHMVLKLLSSTPSKVTIHLKMLGPLVEDKVSNNKDSHLDITVYRYRRRIHDIEALQKKEEVSIPSHLQ